jgi:Rap1a immunity proteins
MLRRFLIIAFAAVVLSLMATEVRCEACDWGCVGRALEKREFCAKNPEHDSCKPATASTLLMRCDSSDASDVAYCHGFLSAVASGGPANLPEWRCVPKGVEEQPEQLRLLFIREAHRMPEVLHLPAQQLLYYAVIKAFPCPLRGR